MANPNVSYNVGLQAAANVPDVPRDERTDIERLGERYGLSLGRLRDMVDTLQSRLDRVLCSVQPTAAAQGTETEPVPGTIPSHTHLSESISAQCDRLDAELVRLFKII